MRTLPLTQPTFALITEEEINEGIYNFINFDDWFEREDEYMQALGFLALLSGRLPTEIFNDDDWPKTLLFNLKCSNAVFKVLLEAIRGNT